MTKKDCNENDFSTHSQHLEAHFETMLEVILILVTTQNIINTVDDIEETYVTLQGELIEISPMNKLRYSLETDFSNLGNSSYYKISPKGFKLPFTFSYLVEWMLARC